MNKIRIVILLVWVASVSYSQEQYQDNFGDNLLEKTFNGGLLEIRTEPDVFTFLIARDKNQLKEDNEVNKVPARISKVSNSGFRSLIEVGYNMNMGYYGIDRLNLDIIEHYQLQNISFGLGIGARSYLEQEAILMPLFIDVRASMRSKTISRGRKPYTPASNKISPYASVGFGYTFDATNSFNGVGILFKPTIGINSNVSNNLNISFGIGYESQRMPFFYAEEYIASSDAISFNVGFSF